LARVGPQRSDMLRRMIHVALLVALVRRTSTGQTKFEVVSVRPVSEDTNALAANLSSGEGQDVRHVRYLGITMQLLIQLAYPKVNRVQIDDSQTRFARWNLQAELPKGATKADVPGALRAMLAERFDLRAHEEVLTKNGFAIVMIDPVLVSKPRKIITELSPISPDGQQSVPWSVSMDRLARFLTGMLRNPVEDGTGLGDKVVPLEIRHNVNGNVELYEDEVRRSLRIVGLDLKKTRGVEEKVLIVEHIRKTPTEN
jgi:uncharacterized protein (TIGR03435 family)